MPAVEVDRRALHLQCDMLLPGMSAAEGTVVALLLNCARRITARAELVPAGIRFSECLDTIRRQLAIEDGANRVGEKRGDELRVFEPLARDVDMGTFARPVGGDREQQ